MIIEKAHTVVEKHEVTNEELDEALFAMLNPTFNDNWCETYLQEAIELVRLAYENGYRLRIEKLEEEKAITEEEAITELQNTIYLIKQDGKDWVDERDIPIFEKAIEALKHQEEISKIINRLNEIPLS